MTTHCFIDTETTSLRHNRRIWEVAIIKRTPVNRTQHLFQIKDVDLTFADPFALDIGGFWERYEGYKGTAKGQVYTERDASLQIRQLTHNAVVVGNVPWFDTEAMSRMMCRNGLIETWHYHLVDVYVMMQGYIKAKDSRYVVDHVKSDDLSKAIDVEPPTEDERHTALGDALWAERIYDMIMDNTPPFEVVAETVIGASNANS